MLTIGRSAGACIGIAQHDWEAGLAQGRVVGKSAIVTGGASGIGAACARRLAAEGAAVMVADMNEQMGGDVVAAIEAAGGTACFLKLDVTDEAQWIDAMALIKARFGGLNIAVNCAGTTVTSLQYPTEIDLDEWRRIMSVNLDGIFLANKHQVALMEQTAPVNGSVINLSSVLGIVGQPGISPYNASKGGVRLFTKSLALSCAQKGVNIRANSVHPGFIRTPMLEVSISRMPSREEGLKFYNALQPIGRLGEPDDIANGVLYLASDEASFVTGSELIIDGGYTAK